MRLFDRLEIETQSTCNRTCTTCLRNSYPGRAAVAGYFAPQQMPTALIYDLLDQAAALDFRGRVGFSVYNEPLLDDRLPALAAYAQRVGDFAVTACTNADLLTPELAAQLDGVFDALWLALYDDGPRRAQMYRAWFQHTTLIFTGGRHIPRHYRCSAAAIQVAAGQPCEMETQQRMLIRHDGAFLLCCEDIAGLYSLGNVTEQGLYDLWFGAPHRSLLQRLAQPGGRAGYCLSCPQPNVPYWSAGASDDLSFCHHA